MKKKTIVLYIAISTLFSLKINAQESVLLRLQLQFQGLTVAQKPTQSLIGFSTSTLFMVIDELGIGPSYLHLSSTNGFSKNALGATIMGKIRISDRLSYTPNLGVLFSMNWMPTNQDFTSKGTSMDWNVDLVAFNFKLANRFAIGASIFNINISDGIEQKRHLNYQDTGTTFSLCLTPQFSINLWF